MLMILKNLLTVFVWFCVHLVRLKPSGKLPYILLGENKQVPCCNIINILAENGYGKLDDDIVDKGTLCAFSTMVEHDLWNCQLFSWWKDQKNYENVTHSSYSTLLPFPRNWFAPKQMQKTINERLNLLDVTKETQIYQVATEIYSTLALKLGEKQYFFGERPTSFDAIAFAYLSTQYYAPFQKSVLRHLISQHVNLKDFIARILRTYFDSEFETLNEESLPAWKLQRKPLKNNIAQKSKEDPSKTNFQILSLGVGALGLFLSVYNKQTKSLMEKAFKSNEDEEGEEESRFFFKDDYLEDDEDDMMLDYLNNNDIFFDKENEPYIADDGGAYDWDEGYLEEMRTGDIPDETLDLESDNDE